MTPWIQVCLGGAAGSLIRYLFSGLFASANGTSFPWGIFTTNVAGCLVIGLLYGAMPSDSPWRPMVIIGLLGGFTTFSSFGIEAFQLIQNKAWMMAVLYILGTNLAALAAVIFGHQLANR